MKTAKQLIDEVNGELNAVAAANQAFDALYTFAAKAQSDFAAGDALATKEGLDNLVALIPALKAAVPANVAPATAGPVGKSATEQELEAALAVSDEHLTRMQDVLPKVLATIKDLSEAVDSGIQAKLNAVRGLAIAKRAQDDAAKANAA